MKIIIDTNILISYLLGNANVIKIFNYVKNSSIDVVADSRLLDEYSKIIKRKKFNFSELQINSVNEFINSKIEICQISSNIIKFNPDRQDSKLIEIANSQNCDFIITDDKMLLSRADYLTKAKIISSNNFFDCI